jgi:hypothetical protein
MEIKVFDLSKNLVLFRGLQTGRVSRLGGAGLSALS